MTIWALFLAAAVLTVIAFLTGYIPLEKRRAVVLGRGQRGATCLTTRRRNQSGQVHSANGLDLPGTIEPITEAPFWPAGRLLEKRRVDIGDRVKAGQTCRNRCARTGRSGAAGQGHRRTTQSAIERPPLMFNRAKPTRSSPADRRRSAQLVVKGAISRQDDDQRKRNTTPNSRPCNRSTGPSRSSAATSPPLRPNLARLKKWKAIAWCRRLSTA